MITPERLDDPVHALELVRAMLSDARRWTTDFFARNAGGYSVPVTDKHAVCWCLLGAFLALEQSHSVSEKASERATCLLNQARGLDPMDEDLGDFNDTHTHAEVLALLDRTIERAKTP